MIISQSLAHLLWAKVPKIFHLLQTFLSPKHSTSKIKYSSE